MILERKTLMVGEGKYREFLGHVHQVGWVTASSPIDIYNKETKMEHIAENYKEVGFDEDAMKTRLVNIKIEVLDDEH